MTDTTDELLITNHLKNKYIITAILKKEGNTYLVDYESNHQGTLAGHGFTSLFNVSNNNVELLKHEMIWRR